jgi:hypothetical protein
MRRLSACIAIVVLWSLSAQAQEQQPQDKKESESAETPGLVLPNSDRLRVGLRFMAGYGFDGAQDSLGFEKQGRVGYIILSAAGKLSRHFRYLLEVNPVNETQPRPACGEENYFYPNAPQATGPNVSCSNDGRVMVDDYRFKALDTVSQQGPVRQAYLVYEAGSFGVKFGRFLLPIGFGWEDAGSLSSKDAPHIQRINTEANFGVLVQYQRSTADGRRFFTGSAAVVAGDGNKYHDYDYFYGIDGSQDSNSWQTVVLSATTEPVKGLDLRAAIKAGHTGSKVERLPNFYASKRNDNAIVLSGRYRPIRNITIFGESAQYTWGLMKTSAEMLGVESSPVEKNGYYAGADVWYPLSRSVRVGTVVTAEELSRDDALVKYMAGQGLYRAQLGKKERSTVIRVYTDITDAVRVGVYRNDLSNPFPWLSGIVPVDGPRAYQAGRGSNKWGMVVQFRVQ